MGDFVCLTPGELTAVYQSGGSEKNLQPSLSAVKASQILQNGLTASETSLLGLRSQDKQYYIYGAGLLGSFVSSLLKPKVLGFIDDNRQSAGSSLFGLPILTLNMITDRACAIVVAVPPAVAEKVAERSRVAGFQTYVPFQNVAMEGA